MTAREDREKEKFTKETVVKYFFDMSKSTYTIMVLGGLAALFGIVETNESGTISAILLGVVLSAVLSIKANVFILLTFRNYITNN